MNFNFEMKEKLCIEVQKFPFLFDKSNKDYKNRIALEGWKIITQSLGLEGLYVILLSLVAYPLYFCARTVYIAVHVAVTQ